MSDQDVDAATITVPDLIAAIKNDNFTLAGNQFSDLVNDKLQTSLNQNKVRLASSIFNGGEEDEDASDYEFSDDEDNDADAEEEEEFDDDAEEEDEEWDKK